MQSIESVNPFNNASRENGKFLSNFVLDEPFEREVRHYPEDTIVEPRGLTKNKERTTAEDTIVEAKGPVFRDESAIVGLEDDILKPEEKEKLGIADTLHVSNEPVVSTRPKELETEPFQETSSFILPPDMEEAFDLHNAGKRSESRHDDGIAWSELSREQRLNIVKEFRDYIAAGNWSDGVRWLERFIPPAYFEKPAFRQAAQKGILASLKDKHPFNAIRIAKSYLESSDPILRDEEIKKALLDCFKVYKEAYDREKLMMQKIDEDALKNMAIGDADQFSNYLKDVKAISDRLQQRRIIFMELHNLFGTPKVGF